MYKQLSIVYNNYSKNIDVIAISLKYLLTLDYRLTQTKRYLKARGLYLYTYIFFFHFVKWEVENQYRICAFDIISKSKFNTSYLK